MSADTSEKVTHRPTIGRVVSNKMQKSVTVSI
jgi:ribosomal protein S17